MTSSRPTVSARDLSLRYPSRNPETRSVAVNGLSFDIAEGEVLTVVGESGSGKSTLAKAVALQAETGAYGSPLFSGGLLSVMGVELRSVSRRKRDRLSLRVGYLPQDAGTHLNGRLTIGENIAEPIFVRDRRFNQREAAEAVATLIDTVRLPLATMNRYPYELSKGQRQRVAIARSMILEPQLLVADDPTAGIDINARAAILDLIVGLQKERAFSALLVTADLAAVRRISTNVAVMHRGIVVGIGELDEVLSDPWHPYVQGLAHSLAELHREQH
ncbi:ATP-binding cassette domain-containing protein [Rhodoglobus vestalii]|uniref:ATP-binding cassette domain-containing protein n=1 Tax=Rhodoglobus vestalii TaxID=193384 RepID=UPI001FE317F9|nr:ABC transporter ATP-binding protein [Rhodoglobus vestalii]